MKILAIETSCDETSIAIVEASGARENAHFRILSHIISSQVKIHEKYGGVVPNLAKREHQRNLVPILVKSLKEAGMYKESRKQKIQNSKFKILNSILEREPELWGRFKKNIIPLRKPPIDVIAVTVGPGLEPALWVGINFAKALSTLWNIPIIPVDHMEGHIYSALLAKQNNDKFLISNVKFPILALLVSGGHTELVLVKGFGQYTIVGQTLDDAAGEAFDKIARLLGLPYPGGPEISMLASLASQNVQDRVLISLPRPMIHSNDFNFSFSGLKTAVLYLIRDLQKQKHDIKKLGPAIAKEFQNAVVEILVSKTIRAAKHYHTKTILLAGGVAANTLLRTELTKSAKQIGTECLIVDPSLTGDNALMIAVAAFFNQKKATKKYSLLKANGQLRLA